MAIWYMRDNHTFRKLPNDADAALKIIADEARDGFTYGTLCASNPYTKTVGMKGSADWIRFDKEARKWFAEYQAEEQPQ